MQQPGGAKRAAAVASMDSADDYFTSSLTAIHSMDLTARVLRMGVARSKMKRSQELEAEHGPSPLNGREQTGSKDGAASQLPRTRDCDCFI